MTPENLPIDEIKLNPEAGQDQAAKAPVTPEHPLTLEEIEDGAQQIEAQHIVEARQEALNTMTPEDTLHENMTPEGVLFTPQKEEPIKKSGWAWLPSWAQKTIKVAGIASVGALSAQHAHALDKPGQQKDNTGQKTEIEHIRLATDDEMTAYNDYLKFLETKHMAGKEELNSIETEKKLIEEFNKTAKIKLEWSSIKPVQFRLKELRKKLITKSSKDGKIEIVDNDGKIASVDTALFMPNLSRPDGLIGIKSSEHPVPIQTNAVVDLKKDETVVSKEFRPLEERNTHY